MSWTDERVLALKKFWAEGHSASAIAKQLGGVTKNAVIGKRLRLGLPKRDTVAQVVRNPRKVKRKPLPKMAEPDPKFIPPPKPKDPPKPSEPMRHVDIIDLARDECRWPVNDAAIGEQHLFCGRKMTCGSSYCAEHKDKATSKLSEATLKVAPVSRKAAMS